MAEGFDNMPLAPYEVQWRPDYTCRWGATQPADSHEDAQDKAAEMRSGFGGQTRIITQHVIEVHSLVDRKAA